MRVLYKELAKYYDLIYRNKDYTLETEYLHKFFKRYNVRKILDAACGTGNHDIYLVGRYNVTGIDLSKELLKIARKKVKGATYYQMNMKNFNLNKKFDAVICMFSAIAYNTNMKELIKTLKNFYNHLNDRGILIFDIHFNRESFKDGYRSVDGFDIKNVTLARFGLSKKIDRRCRVSFSYLLRENSKFKYLKDSHILGMFSVKEYSKALKKAGFRATVYNGFTMQKVKKPSKLYKDYIFIGVKNGIWI